MNAMLDALSAVVPPAKTTSSASPRCAGPSAFDSVPLRLKLSEDEIARFSVERWRFGASTSPYLTRYPLGAEFAHVVGYVGRIDINEASG
jgi:penicillin-binding protein 2